MSTGQTVVINGRHYDARTGLPVAEPHSVATAAPSTQSATRSARTTVAATKIHAKTQRSQTLNRKHTKKPTVARPTVQSINGIAPRKKPVVDMVAPKSQAISKFAPHPAAITPRKAPVRSADIGPVPHPHVVKAHQKSAAKQAPVAAQHPASAQAAAAPAAQKEQLLAQAIANTTTKQPAKKKKFTTKRHPRAMSIISAAFALVLMAGYLTYLNMPSLSVRVAAAQAGIDASYPQYRPDGYSLRGPVAYDQGEVAMTFGANGGSKNFTIKQTKSGWDSSAVLDNYVTPRAGASYIPYTERGLTIYTYDGNAAWVNGGILYTIEGDAPLSSEQIRRIATSFI